MELILNIFIILGKDNFPKFGGVRSCKGMVYIPVAKTKVGENVQRWKDKTTNWRNISSNEQVREWPDIPVV